MMFQYRLSISLLLFLLSLTAAFLHQAPIRARTRTTVSEEDCLSNLALLRSKAEDDEPSPSISYEETDSSSKGLVSSLTGIVNFFSFPGPEKENDPAAVNYDDDNPPPKSPEELLERIRDDYVVRNYLWTGKIDLAAFDRQCKFTDPTLSFVGTDQFTKNLNNLVPIVAALTKPGGCKSDLLSINLNRDKCYVESRWNMVGSFSALPWNPKIDVIGRTKFWYKEDDAKKYYRVFFYDEEWEIPAGKALLQLVTPEGTISSSTGKKS